MTASDDEIVKILDDFDRESKAIKQELLKMCWFMRGGITYEEASQLTINEREMIAKIIQENLEITKKSGIGFF